MFREKRIIGFVWEHEEMKKKAEGLEKSVFLCNGWRLQR